MIDGKPGFRVLRSKSRRMRMKFASKAGLMALALLSMGWNALLAGNSGKISGVVRDARTQEALAGANVVIASRWQGDRLIPLDIPLGAATDQDGSYYILNIDPGDYSLEVTYIGYTKSIIERVSVFVDMTSFIDVNLQVSALESEAVVVESQRRNTAQKDLTATKQVYQISEVQSIAGVNDIGDIIGLQADVVDNHFRGGREGESQYILGGGTIVNPLSNSKAFSPIVTGLEQVEVYTSGFSAEYGNAQSGVINMVTREGRSTWESRAELSYTAPYYKTWLEVPDGDSSKSVVPGSPYDMRSFDYYTLLSDTSEWLKDNPQNPGRALYDLGYGFGPGYLPARTVWPPNPLTYADSIQLARLGQLSWYESKRLMGLDRKAGLDNRIDFSTGGPLTDATNLFLAGRQTTNYSAYPIANPDIERQIMGSLVFHPDNANKLKFSGIYDVNTETYFSSSWQQWLFDPIMATSQRRTVSSQYGLEWKRVISRDTYANLKANLLNIAYDEFIPLLQTGDFAMDYLKMSNWVDYTGPANMRAGRMIDDNGSENTSTYSVAGDIASQVNRWNLLKGGAQFYYYNLNVNRLYNRYGEADIRILDFKVHPYEGALFLQDKMEFEGMIANVGLREDIYQLNYDYYADIYSPLRNPDSLAHTKTYTKLQPRLGISFPVNETTVLHLNYGTFTQRPSFNQIFYNQVNVKGEIAILGNPRLRPEETNAYDIGLVKGIPFLDLSLDVSAYYKDVKNLVETAFYYDDQQIGYQTYVNRDYADIKGFHINLEKNYGNLKAYIRYNWESATGKSSNALDAPVTYFEKADPHYGMVKLPDPQDVYLNYDRTHKIVMNVRYKTPGKFGFHMGRIYPLQRFQMSVTYRYYSGRPYTDPSTGLLYSMRTPEETDLRLRIEKDIRVGETTLTFYTEGFNLLNRYNWNYSRTFSNSYNTPRWRTDPQDLLTYELYSPYVTSQEIYLLTNDPQHWRFGLIVKL